MTDDLYSRAEALTFLIGGGLLAADVHLTREGVAIVGWQEKRPDLSTPQKALASFIDAIRTCDSPMAARCVDGGKPFTMPPSAQASTIEIKLDSAEYSMQRDTATVKVTASIPSPSAGKRLARDETLELKRVGAEWKIVEPTVGPQGYLTAFAMTFAHPEMAEAARTQARATTCLSNMRQIALGCVLFVQDHNAKFELTIDNFKKSVMAYAKNESLFHCPADGSGNVSYSFNHSLTGVTLATVSMPSATIMIYEGKDGKLNYGHSGSALVSFADGRAKTIGPADEKLLRWKP